MNEQELFTIKDFVNIARTTRNTLVHYDDIGLLPALRGKSNNYRYYSAPQLSTLNLIHILKELGMSLEDILMIKDERTPEFMEELLISQIETVDRKINEWVKAKKLLFAFQKIIHSAVYADERAITIQYLPTEAIILGNANDYGQNRNDYNALLTFYTDMHEKYPDLDLNYPVWARFRGERIRLGDWRWPDRYYFYNSEGHDRRPSGFYAIGYARGSYGQTDELYTQLKKYIDEKGYEISGDAYEEYPLNEFSISNASNYLIRIMISVKERDQV